MENYMDMGISNGNLMELNIRDNGLIIKSMVWVQLHGLMGIHIQDIIAMETLKEIVFINGVMDKLNTAITQTIENMEMQLK